MTAAPGSRQRKIIMLTLCALLGAGLLLVYALADPASNHHPRCAFRMLTGLSCPGCGSQRALHALLHADIAEAFRMNALFVIELPLIVLLALSRLPSERMAPLRRILSARTFILLLLLTIIIWTIVRNIIDV